MEWDNYWDSFLKEKRLVTLYEGLSEVDEDQKNDKDYTKNICKEIYDNYEKISHDLETIKGEVEKKLEKVNNVHLLTGRVKSKDSIIEKVIKKRNEYAAGTNRYSDMSFATLTDALTDLIGLKFVINYRGKWKSVHDDILDIFPMLEGVPYENDALIPHRTGESFIAEQPIAYYANGDDISQYEEAGLRTKVHSKGYRSIHYIISFKNTYIELQLRTIYDEAWSDCDHNYVYKQEANPNNVALKELSQILNNLTNAANDIGDMMHEIFYQKSFSKADDGNKWLVDNAYKTEIKKILNAIEKGKNDFAKFDSNLIINKEGEQDV